MFNQKIIIQADATKAKTVFAHNQNVFNGIRIYPLRMGIFNTRKNDSISTFFSIQNDKADDNKGLTKIEGYPDTQCMRTQNYGASQKNDLAKKATFTCEQDAIPKRMPMPQLNEIENTPPPKGVQNPVLIDCVYHPAPLNDGFVYISSKIDQGVYVFEYTWNGGLKFDAFYSSNEHLEKNKKRDTAHFFIAHMADELKILFLPVKLPKTIILDELYDKTHPHQIIVNCQDWTPTGNGVSDLSKNIIEVKDGWCFWECNNYLMEYHEARYYIVNNTFRQIEQTITQNNTLRDIFVILHDPIGLVAHINDDLTNEHLNHEALIRSIRTGIEPSKIKEVIEKLSSKGYVTDDTVINNVLLEKEHKDNIEQIQLIHALGAGLYKAIFDINHSFPKADEAEDNIDSERLFKILAVNERIEFHKKIEGKRQALAAVLESDIFQSFCKFFGELQHPSQRNEKCIFWDTLIDVRTIIGNFYQNLAQRPFDKDNGLNLSTLYGDGSAYANDDPGFNAIKALNNKENEAGKFLAKEIDLKKYLNKKNWKKTDNSPQADDKADISASLVAKYVSTTHAILSAITKVGFTPLEITFCKTINNEAGRKIIPLTQAEITDRLNKIARQQGGMSYRPVAGSWQRTIDGNQGRITIGIERSNISKFERAIHAVATNPLFESLIDIIAIKEAGAVSKDNPLRATLDTAAFVVLVQNTFDKYRSMAAVGAQQTTTQVGLRALKFTWGTAGAYIGTAIDLTDAYKTWNSRDYDAMACNIVSATSGLGGLGLAAFYAKASWAGWAGLALATLSIGSKFLYEYCKDTPFESFVKKTVFYDRFKFDNSMLPYQLLRDIAKPENRRDCLLTGRNIDEMYINTNYLLEEFIYLHSYLFNLNVSLFLNKISTPQYNVYGNYLNTTKTVSDIGLTISTDFSLLANNIHELWIEAYYVHDNVDFWVMQQDSPKPLFNSNNSELIFLPPNYKAGSMNVAHQLSPEQQKWQDNQRLYRGIQHTELKNNKFSFAFHRKEGELKSFGNQLKFAGANTIPSICEVNDYLVVMLKLKTGNGEIVPLPKPNNNERWLCYKYKITAGIDQQETTLELDDSNFYSKNEYWKTKF